VRNLSIALLSVGRSPRLLTATTRTRGEAKQKEARDTNNSRQREKEAKNRAVLLRVRVGGALVANNNDPKTRSQQGWIKQRAWWARACVCMLPFFFFLLPPPLSDVNYPSLSLGA
jgi:hypothetical protein